MFDSVLTGGLKIESKIQLERNDNTLCISCSVDLILDLLHGFGEEGGKGEGLAPVATDTILNLEEAGVHPRNEHTIDCHQQLHLAPCDQGLDNQIGGEDNWQVLQGPEYNMMS